LKSDCRILNRNIKLVTSPIAVDGHGSSLESDVSQWLISEQGNKFCVIDKPYHKSQTKEPAMAVCIDDATIFGHFNRIGQNIQETKKQLAGLFTQYQDSRQHLKLFPPAEIQKGHLFICLTLNESEIDAIARTIRIAIPFIYHNDSFATTNSDTENFFSWIRKIESDNLHKLAH
ncbi:hypothetical protein T05_12039, partial [Trichinella murrelli]